MNLLEGAPLYLMNRLPVRFRHSDAFMVFGRIMQGSVEPAAHDMVVNADKGLESLLPLEALTTS